MGGAALQCAGMMYLKLHVRGTQILSRLGVLLFSSCGRLLSPGHSPGTLRPCWSCTSLLLFSK